GQSAERLHAALACQVLPEDTALALPAPLASRAGGRLLAFAAMEGPRIADLTDEAVRPAMDRLGTALAAFHSLLPPPAAPRFTRHDPDRLAQTAGLLGRACPVLAEQSAALAAELARHHEPSSEAVCLHGDVHPKNAVLRGERIALIDLDKACLGEPAVDLGSFLSLLRYQRVIGDLSEDEERARAEAVLGAYARRRTRPAARVLAWHTAAALLAEQAFRAVRQLRPAALRALDRLLLEARRVLDDEGHECR